jgi:hypothetical protein
MEIRALALYDFVISTGEPARRRMSIRPFFDYTGNVISLNRRGDMRLHQFLNAFSAGRVLDVATGGLTLQLVFSRAGNHSGLRQRRS